MPDWGSFWGLNQSGQQSKQFAPQYANWNWNNAGQYNQWADQYKNRGDFRQGELWDDWRDFSRRGIGTPEQSRDVGRLIMPSVEQAAENRRRRLENQYQNWNNFQDKAAPVADKIDENLNQQGKDLTSHYTDLETTIAEGTGALKNRAGQTTGDIKDLINKTFDTAGSGYSDEIKRLIDMTGKGYADLGANADKTYAQMLQETESMKPGSEAFQARVARSFAPATSAALSRMRMGNVDPNSVQASGILGSLDADKARAMDDAAAAGDEKYFATRRGILGDKLGTSLGLGRDSLGRILGFGEGLADTNLDLALGRGGALQGETIRSSDEMQGIDREHRDLNMANKDTSYTRGVDWRDKQNDAALKRRGMNLEDFGIEGGLINQLNQEEMFYPEAMAKQFTLGQGFAKDQYDAQTGALQGAGQLQQQDYANLWNAQNAQQGAGNAAYNAHMQNLINQSGNAGWGSRLIGGLAMGGLGSLFNRRRPTVSSDSAPQYGSQGFWDAYNKQWGLGM
jgi:hypothetical protein